MSEKITSEAVSRRRVLSVLAAAVGFALPTTVLMAPGAEAQTIGMQRRHERRAYRHDRRQDRRADRYDRRYDRRADRYDRRYDRRTGGTPQ